MNWKGLRKKKRVTLSQSTILQCKLSWRVSKGLYFYLGFPGGTSGPVNAGETRDVGFASWVGKIWRRAQQPTLVFLPGEYHGLRSLVSYSQWDCKELDTTEAI